VPFPSYLTYGLQSMGGVATLTSSRMLRFPLTFYHQGAVRAKLAEIGCCEEWPIRGPMAQDLLHSLQPPRAGLGAFLPF
jgi:hypothetical protein